MTLLVVAGFFLQLNWIQRVRRNPDVAADPDSLTGKLGRWMLEKRGGAAAGVAAAPGVETIECNLCLGTGNVLGDDGHKALCPVCLGVGSRLIRRLDPEDHICPNCVGMGRVYDAGTGRADACPRCAGRGLVGSPAPAGN